MCRLLTNNITLYFAGQSCSTFLDLLVRLVNLIFGRQGSWCPRGGPPQGTPPTTGGNPPEDDLGGYPTGGTNPSPPDVEEIDPSQNDAVRDWE